MPFHHEEGNSWRETATRAGIIFDRLRIATLVDPVVLPTKTRTEMAKWSEMRVKNIRKLAIEQR